jgi:uncharacterized membrane protein
MRMPKLILKYLLTLVFVFSGVNHFINTAFYVRIMPPYLPRPALLVYLSGFFEIALGSLLLIPRCTPLVAWGLIALLLAVFPANLHMAINHELFPEYAATGLWLRLPFQLVFIAWAFWYAGYSVVATKKR